MPQALSRNEMSPYHFLPLKKTLAFLADKEPFALLETARCDSQNRLSYIFFEPAGINSRYNFWSSALKNAPKT